MKRFDKQVKGITDEAIKKLNSEIRNQKDDLSELQKMLIKNAWLIMETKNEFGGPRDQQAREIMLKEINSRLAKIIPNEQKRQQWIEELQKSLPER